MQSPHSSQLPPGEDRHGRSITAQPGVPPQPVFLPSSQAYLEQVEKEHRYFGTSGIGDPACDTTIAWTFLTGESQRVFTEQLPADEATWTRGRGWAIWKAMIVLAGALVTDPDEAEFTKNIVAKIIADHCDAR